MRKHSSKIQAQIISQVLFQLEIRQIVISPGSRNAPLIIEFANGSEFENFNIVDERSAAFFALGLAQQSNKPVALVCTSGSALLNYYPAIAEAFYSQIPLIIISADRPQKWVDQGEGQTIRQHNVFKNHSWYNITLNEGQTKKESNENIDLTITAVKTAIEKQGPVHINVPFDEPLYGTTGDSLIKLPDFSFNPGIKVFDEDYLEQFAHRWNASKRKMILVGQHKPSEFLQLQLEKFSQDSSVIVLHENISNIKHQNFIGNIDQVIFSLDDFQLKEFSPDFLITVGRNIISKKIKYFLRKFSPKEHWHIEQTSLPPNTFEALTQHFDTQPEMFFSQFLFLHKAQNKSDFQKKWLDLKLKHRQKHTEFLQKAPFSDLKIFDIIFQHIPNNYVVHWANSTVVRYAQLFDYKAELVYYSNRGTSGIDGSISTAVGAANVSNIPVLMVTGDLSFFYDSNALWNKYIPDNFKLIVINNGGGDIFNFIPGPSQTEAVKDFFVSPHQLHMDNLADMFGFHYLKSDNVDDLHKKLTLFFNQNKKPQLLEIDTSKVNNSAILKSYFNNFKISRHIK